MYKEWVISEEDLGCDGAYLSYNEVVRCKDCRWHEQEQPGMVYCPYIVGNWVEDDWFCADGERRKDAD